MSMTPGTKDTPLLSIASIEHVNLPTLLGQEEQGFLIPPSRLISHETSQPEPRHHLKYSTRLHLFQSSNIVLDFPASGVGQLQASACLYNTLHIFKVHWGTGPRTDHVHAPTHAPA